MRIRPTLLVAGLALAAGIAKGAEEKETPTISVTGTGKVSAAPDVAEIHAGVVTQAQTARDALRANSEAMKALQDVLKERGVATKDVQTSNLSVAPQYSQPPRIQPQPGQEPKEYVPRIVGYQVSNTVEITVRDLSKFGVLLDAIVQAGANQLHGITFRVDEPEKLLDQARKRAVADARRKAELYAGESGVVVGSPISIRESDAVAPPRPMMLGRGRSDFMAQAASVPVAAGEQDLNVTIHIIYELKAAK